MITFLIIIGGLLILFTYIRRIASNEKFKLKFNLTLVLLVILILLDQLILNTQINDNLIMNYTQNIELSIIKIYNIKSIIITIIIVIYLLLTIISVTKIVKHHKGPLRAFNKYEKYKSTCTKK